ncbi:MAG: sigma-70 family RNA polymerase sigma factor [Candidatus Nanopelagicales bacterium]
MSTGLTHPGEDWLTELFGRHSAAVLAYANRRVSSVEDAEDVVVEVFATAWRRRADVPAEPLPWLYATAGNVIAHVIRSESRRSRLGSRLASVTPLRIEPDPAVGIVAASDARAVVAAAMGELAESDAELLRLWAWEQLEPAEIAVVLDCSPGTARTRLHRAKARLREALTHAGLAAADQPPPQPPAQRPAQPPAERPAQPPTRTGSEDHR